MKCPHQSTRRTRRNREKWTIARSKQETWRCAGGRGGEESESAHAESPKLAWMSTRTSRSPARSRISASGTKQPITQPDRVLNCCAVCATGTGDLRKCAHCEVDCCATCFADHKCTDAHARLEARMWRARRAALFGLVVAIAIYYGDPVLWA
eukprot:scaffold273600_cov36-Tisochrysis_lutea.AAC.2